MKRIAVTLIFLASLSCRDAAGPSNEESPGGSAVVWFNGLSANADAWYPEADSLIHGAWLTGSAPNQILPLDDHSFAILSSLDAELFTASLDETGEYLLHIPLPGGTNPYCFTVSGETAWTSLLLADSVIGMDLSDGSLLPGFATRSNPSGIACTDSLIFVAYSNWPDTSSPGGVSVFNRNTYAETAWLDTGINSNWLVLQPTGLVHCYSTTYQGDGKVTIIDPSSGGSVIAAVCCGGAPGEAVYCSRKFISPDGWGDGGLVIYDESGVWERAPLNFAPSGLAVHGQVLYATCFTGNMVYMLDPETFSVTDSIPSGGDGPQGIIAVNPSS